MPVSLSSCGVHPPGVAAVLPPVVVAAPVVVPATFAPFGTAAPVDAPGWLPGTDVTVPPRGATWPTAVVVVAPSAPAWRLVPFFLPFPLRAATTPTPTRAITRHTAIPADAALLSASQPTHPRCATMRNPTGEPEENSRGVGAGLDIVPGGGRGRHLRPRRLRPRPH